MVVLLPVVITVYDLALLLLRVVTGFIVWQHGAQKLFGSLGGAQADPFTLAWIAGAAEFLGGIALAAGFLTRPVALILAVDMGALYITQFLPDGFPPILNRQGEVACLIFSNDVAARLHGARKGER